MASARYCGFQEANSRSQNAFTRGSLQRLVIILRYPVLAPFAGSN